MKKIIGILLLGLFLCGCTADTLLEQLWYGIEIGQKHTFELKHKRYTKIKYYKIEQITKEEYENYKY